MSWLFALGGLSIGGEKGKTKSRVGWGLPAGPAAAAWNPASFSPCPVAGRGKGGGRGAVCFPLPHEKGLADGQESGDLS